MTLNRWFRASLAACLSLALIAPSIAAAPWNDGPAVYIRLVDAAPMSFEDVTATLERGLIDNGWTILAPLDCGVDAEKCEFRTRVIAAYHPEYAQRVMGYGMHAAYAVPVRFAVFEDELGVHVSALNPRNLNRTIVDEASTPDDWEWAAEMIRTVGRSAFPDSFVGTEFGQQRDDNALNLDQKSSMNGSKYLRLLP